MRCGGKIQGMVLYLHNLKHTNFRFVALYSSKCHILMFLYKLKCLVHNTTLLVDKFYLAFIAWGGIGSDIGIAQSNAEYKFVTLREI